MATSVIENRKTDMVQLLDTGFAFTAAEPTKTFACNWSGYKALNIAFGTYNNIAATILVPTSWFRATSDGARPYLSSYNGQTFRSAEVWQNGTDSVKIKVTSNDITSCKVRIYGIV